jgi:hypothetical protein
VRHGAAAAAATADDGGDNTFEEVGSHKRLICLSSIHLPNIIVELCACMMLPCSWLPFYAWIGRHVWTMSRTTHPGRQGFFDIGLQPPQHERLQQPVRGLQGFVVNPAIPTYYWAHLCLSPSWKASSTRSPYRKVLMLQHRRGIEWTPVVVQVKGLVKGNGIGEDVRVHEAEQGVELVQVILQRRARQHEDVLAAAACRKNEVRASFQVIWALMTKITMSYVSNQSVEIGKILVARIDMLVGKASSKSGGA